MTPDKLLNPSEPPFLQLDSLPSPQDPKAQLLPTSPAVSPNPFRSLSKLQPHWSSHKQSLVQPQGLCTHGSCSLELPTPCFSGEWFFPPFLSQCKQHPAREPLTAIPHSSRNQLLSLPHLIRSSSLKLSCLCYCGCLLVICSSFPLDLLTSQDQRCSFFFLRNNF